MPGNTDKEFRNQYPVEPLGLPDIHLGDAKGGKQQLKGNDGHMEAAGLGINAQYQGHQVPAGKCNGEDVRPPLPAEEQGKEGQNHEERHHVLDKIPAVEFHQHFLVFRGISHTGKGNGENQRDKYSKYER